MFHTKNYKRAKKKRYFKLDAVDGGPNMNNHYAIVSTIDASTQWKSAMKSLCKDVGHFPYESAQREDTS